LFIFIAILRAASPGPVKTFSGQPFRSRQKLQGKGKGILQAKEGPPGSRQEGKQG